MFHVQTIVSILKENIYIHKKNEGKTTTNHKLCCNNVTDKMVLTEQMFSTKLVNNISANG